MSKLPCGCVPDASGFGWCSECVRKLREKIWKRMSAKRRNYDRQFAPKQSRVLDEAVMPEEYEAAGCSCHINPPCSYCVNKGDDDE